MKIKPFLGCVYLEVLEWRSWYVMRRPLILIFLGLLIFLWALKGCGVFERPGKQNPSHFEGRSVVLTGIVAALPDSRPKGCVYLLEAETVKSLRPRKATQSVSGLVQVQLMSAPDPLAMPGDRVQVSGRLQKQLSPLIPGVFDYNAFLQSKGIFSLLYTGPSQFKNLGPTSKFSTLRVGWKWRQRILTVFKKHLSSEHTVVLSGLTIGNRPRFHPDIKKVFIETGTMHVLVASGSNVAFVIGLWVLLAQFGLGLRRRWALLTSLPCVWMYVLIVGADPPILRAGVMGTVGIGAYLLSRQDHPVHALVVAGVFMIGFNPRMVFDIGFQMSFLAVLGILLMFPLMDPLFQTWPAALRWMVRLVLLTVCAQLWLFPILVTVFHRFSLIGIVANVVVLPLSAAGLFFGFLLVLVDQTFLIHLVKPVVQSYLDLFLGLVQWLATLSNGSTLSAFPKGSWIFFYYTLLLASLGIKKSQVARVIGVLSGSVLLFQWLFFSYWPDKKAPLTLTWLDTGPRLTTLIELGSGETALVHSGYQIEKSATRVLLPYLAHKKIKEIDSLILTRWNPKSLEELQEFRRQIKIHSLILTTNAPHLWPFQKKSAGDDFTVGDLYIEILPGSKSFQTDTPLLLTFHDKTIVLSHMLSLTTQKDLVSRGLMSLDILASRFSNRVLWDDDFVRELKPRQIIETGALSKTRTSEPPWDGLTPVVPQSKGFHTVPVLKVPPFKRKGGTFRTGTNGGVF